VKPATADSEPQRSHLDSPSVPEDVTIWEWLFDSPPSPLNRNKPSDIGGFTNAATKERIGYDLAKEYATKISTALVHKFGLAKGDVVALFSPNTVWYPIAMFATNRVGKTALLKGEYLGGDNNIAPQVASSLVHRLPTTLRR
jgi:hypothetical protein